MAESHELCEYLDSLLKNQELYLNGLDKWAKSSYPLTLYKRKQKDYLQILYYWR